MERRAAFISAALAAISLAVRLYICYPEADCSGDLQTLSSGEAQQQQGVQRTITPNHSR
jgi:hypothetical protein